MNIRYTHGIYTNAGKALIQIKIFKSFFKWHKFKITRGTSPRTKAEQPSEIKDCHDIPYNDKEVSTGQRPHYTPFPFHSLDTHLIVVVFPWLWVCLSVFSVGSFALQSWKYPRFLSDIILAQRSNHTHINPVKPDNAAYKQNCILRIRGFSYFSCRKKDSYDTTKITRFLVVIAEFFPVYLRDVTMKTENNSATDQESALGNAKQELGTIPYLLNK